MFTRVLSFRRERIRPGQRAMERFGRLRQNGVAGPQSVQTVVGDFLAVKGRRLLIGTG